MTDAADSGINLQLGGRVVLVTGGVRGVGAGISAVFADQGATVVTCARRPVEGLPYEFHSCDVRDDESVKALIDAIVAEHGRLDVVVNNAGGSPYVPAAEASAKFSTQDHRAQPAWAAVGFDARQRRDADPGARRIDRQHRQRQRQAGRRRAPSPTVRPRRASRTSPSTLAVEWAPKVRVNSVVVGMVETEQSELFYGDADSIAAISKNVPLGRLAKPADVGWAAAFLASDAASYISGASLEVHGGGEPPHYLATTTADIK